MKKDDHGRAGSRGDPCCRDEREYCIPSHKSIAEFTCVTLIFPYMAPPFYMLNYAIKLHSGS